MPSRVLHNSFGKSVKSIIRLACYDPPQRVVPTEGTTGQLGNGVGLSGHSLRVGLNAGEGVHVSLAVGGVLCVVLLLAEDLWWGTIILSFSRLGVERAIVNAGADILVVLDLTLLLL